MTPERWQRIEALYHAADGLAPAEQAAFLLAACEDDESLRREVESLLSEPESDSALPLPEGLGAGVPTPSPESTRGAMTGRTLGVYDIGVLLGVGGMGEVYLAHDRKLGRAVAIKVLPSLFTADPERLARLAREARMLAALIQASARFTASRTRTASGS